MNDELSPRSEFWQILARALTVPLGEAFFSALREDLVDDLDDLAHELGLDLGKTLEEFSHVALRLANAEALLVAYSRLFLTPPVPCHLALSWHLEGAHMGPSEKALCELMARNGVIQTPNRHETPDVLPTVLEFVALLFQRLDANPQAEQRAVLEKDLAVLRTHFLGGAVGEMVRLTEQAETDYEVVPVYSRLLKIIDAALKDALDVFFTPLAPDAKRAKPQYFANRADSADLAHCTSCGKSMVTQREMRVIIDRLTKAGLPSHYLELCPDCRDADKGWTSGTSKLKIPGIH